MLKSLHVVLALALLLAMIGDSAAKSQRPSPSNRESNEPPQTQSIQGKEPAPQYPRGTEDSPAFVKIIPTPDEQLRAAAETKREDEKAANDRSIALFTGRLFWATDALSVIAVGQLFAFLWQGLQKLESAERDLDQAELNLRYCKIIAEIDGVVTRRNVNPGNNVLAGQGLMAIRSLDEIWIDANFKETQLQDLRIGQPVDVYADMYGGRRVFPGRISGFTLGTGSTLALLPPQNATGNFVKVVQRLPVRIELQHYDPDKDPLFIGLSVVPYVYLNRPATGPDAGKRLQASVPQSSASAAAPVERPAARNQ